jgi:hypothetical protein
MTSLISQIKYPLALVRCMIHHSQVLANPSSTTILSHVTLHVFHRLIFKNLLLMIKLIL